MVTRRKNFTPEDLLHFSIIIFLAVCPTCVIYDFFLKCDQPKPLTEDLINFSDSNNITGYSRYIVPDIVHLLRFDKPELTFVEMMNIKSILLNHKPRMIIIHCNFKSLKGKYWNWVKDIPELKIQYREKPKYIFGVKISEMQHASDIARIEILMEHGGMYLDNEVFVVRSLHDFRRYEFVISWDINKYIGNQVIISHKNARFLKYWHESYRSYHPEKSDYNAGEFPTKAVLYVIPDLVHRVMWEFGTNKEIVKMLYSQKSNEWNNFYTIHLMTNYYLKHYSRPITFDEKNIENYDKTYGEMARSILKNI